MRKLLIVLFLLIRSTNFINLFAQGSDVFISGYLRKDGTYTQPHFRTAPNRSMFDNYSTKGNFNPYTGKPGWIDPYSKVSSSYYSSIPYSYRSNYENLIIYLNDQDSTNYFKIVDTFDYQYKLFFTALFKLNENKTEEANRIFNTLKKTKDVSSSIYEESSYWFDITSRYIDAEKELEELYSSSTEYNRDGNYMALENKLNSVTNPLNFHHKYLIKLNACWHRHQYLDAKNCLDSLIAYSSETELHDLLVVNYEDIVDNLMNMQKTLDTYRNGTYYYDIETLAGNLQYFILNKKTPLNELKRACFEISKSECTITDSIFIFVRSLNDTSNSNSGIQKVDYMVFRTLIPEGSDDGIYVISLLFNDDTSFLIYRNKLLQFPKSQDVKNSIVFNFKDPNEKEKGFEYLINESLIGGLTERELGDITFQNIKKVYRLYFYCITNSNGKLIDMSRFFK